MKLKHIFLSLFSSSFLLFFLIPSVAAVDDLSVNFFYGSTCPHCKRVEPLIEQLKPKYPEVTFNAYEVYEDYANSVKLSSWFESYQVPANQRGVPVVFVDGSYLVGDTPILENLETAVQELIAEQAEAAPVAVNIAPAETPEAVITDFDPVESPVSPETPETPSISDDAVAPVTEVPDSTSFVWKDWHWWPLVLICLLLFYGVYRFWISRKVCFCLTERQKDYVTATLGVAFLLVFFVLAKNVSPEFLEQMGYGLPLPVFTFFIGLVDGFNPCNLFVLTFLLALLTSASHSRGRVYVVGFTFVLMVYAIYFLFMAAWLNIFQFIGFITPLRVTLALVALAAGLINCKELLFFRQGITLMVQEQHKGPLMRPY